MLPKQDVEGSNPFTRFIEFEFGVSEVMRIKLNSEQLGKLAQHLPFEVMLEQPRDVKGLLEILGHNMPWDEAGFSKFSDPPKKPSRVAFSVEPVGGGYICDIHPAFAYYISDLLSSE